MTYSAISTRLRTAALLAAVCLSPHFVSAQTATYSIRGVALARPSADSTARPAPLLGANILLYAEGDTVNLLRGTNADPDGRWELARVRPGRYVLKGTYVGYHTLTRTIEVTNADVTRQMLVFTEESIALRAVEVTGLRQEVEVRGDTTVYNAEGIKVNPDATAEDVVRRLPGVTVNNGTVEAQGEAVRRVLVDGQEFFGDDAALTLRNLPAEVVGQVQIYDQGSDQARFTGFNDGNTSRTMNIVTRPGMNVGRFGRVSASGGTDNRYLGSGNYNYFDGPERISVLGLTNNMNQQNFSSEDLSGINQAAGGGGGGGGMRVMMGGGGRGGMQFGGGGAAGNFLTGNQSGINTVHSVGFNYINRWGTKTNLNASYFFNASDNSNNQALFRSYLNGVTAGQTYDETAFSTNEQYNHRLNARLEHTIDDKRSFILTPRLRFQDSGNSGATLSRSFDAIGGMLNRATGDSRADRFTYDLQNNLLYRQRFEKAGRTFSVNLGTNLSNTRSDQYQDDLIQYYDENGVLEFTDLRDQFTDVTTANGSVSADIQFTESLSRSLQMSLGYNPSYNVSLSERDAFGFDTASQSYAELDTALTNRYENRTFTHRASVGLRYNNEKWNGNVGLNLESSTLDGDQTFPVEVDTRRTWTYLVPNAYVQYRFSRTRNLNLNYRAFTRLPSASQLQDVYDISNPLQVRGGNPNLAPAFTHNLNLRLQDANPLKATFVMLFANASYTQDYIGTRTYTATGDTLLAPGVTLGRGGRLTAPANLGGSWSLRSFANRTQPVPFIKSNLSINGGVSYTMQPTDDNGVRSQAKTIGLNMGTMLNSNISPNVDFMFGYFGSYSIVENTEAVGIDNNYYTGRAFARMNLLPRGKWLIATDLNLTHYEGLSDDFQDNTYYWNASVGYKFLKNNAGEIKLTVVDLLGQNNSVNRQVNDGYVEDVRSDVLTRYAMLSFTYTFRNFRGAMAR